MCVELSMCFSAFLCVCGVSRVCVSLCISLFLCVYMCVWWACVCFSVSICICDVCVSLCFLVSVGGG